MPIIETKRHKILTIIPACEHMQKSQFLGWQTLLSTTVPAQIKPLILLHNNSVTQKLAYNCNSTLVSDKVITRRNIFWCPRNEKLCVVVFLGNNQCELGIPSFIQKLACLKRRQNYFSMGKQAVQDSWIKGALRQNCAKKVNGVPQLFYPTQCSAPD